MSESCVRKVHGEWVLHVVSREKGSEAEMKLSKAELKELRETIEKGGELCSDTALSVFGHIAAIEAERARHLWLMTHYQGWIEPDVDGLDWRCAHISEDSSGNKVFYLQMDGSWSENRTNSAPYGSAAQAHDALIEALEALEKMETQSC